MGKLNKKKTTQADSLNGSQSSTGFYNFEDCIDYDVNYHLKAIDVSKRNYKKEYKKYGKGKAAKLYRAILNRINNRKKKTVNPELAMEWTNLIQEKTKTGPLKSPVSKQS